MGILPLGLESGPASQFASTDLCESSHLHLLIANHFTLCVLFGLPTHPIQPTLLSQLRAHLVSGQWYRLRSVPAYFARSRSPVRWLSVSWGMCGQSIKHLRDDSSGEEPQGGARVSSEVGWTGEHQSGCEFFPLLPGDVRVAGSKERGLGSSPPSSTSGPQPHSDASSDRSIC